MDCKVLTPPTENHDQPSLVTLIKEGVLKDSSRVQWTIQWQRGGNTLSSVSRGCVMAVRVALISENRMEDLSNCQIINTDTKPLSKSSLNSLFTCPWKKCLFKCHVVLQSEKKFQLFVMFTPVWRNTEGSLNCVSSWFNFHFFHFPFLLRLKDVTSSEHFSPLAYRRLFRIISSLAQKSHRRIIRDKYA